MKRAGFILARFLFYFLNFFFKKSVFFYAKILVYQKIVISLSYNQTPNN